MILGSRGPLTGLKCLDWKVKRSVIQFVLLTPHTPNSTLFRSGHWLDCCTRNDDHWWKTGHVCEPEIHLPNSKLQGRFYHPGFLFLKADGESSQRPNPGLSNFKSSHSSKHWAVCSLFQAWSNGSRKSLSFPGEHRGLGKQEVEMDEEERNCRSSDSPLGQWALLDGAVQEAYSAIKPVSLFPISPIFGSNDCWQFPLQKEMYLYSNKKQLKNPWQ